jgi:hypothetical protein
MAELTLPPLAIDAGSSGGPVYSSAAIRSAISALLEGGAAPGMARTGALHLEDFKVTLSGVSVNVGAGGYAVATSQGAYVCALNSVLNLGALAPADATNARADLVVLRVDDPSNGGTEARSASVLVVTGTPAASPQLPAVTDTAVYAPLARIDVPRSGAGSPTITDLRTWTAATGGVVPFRTQSEITAWAAPGGTLAYCIADAKTYIRQSTGWKTLVVEDDTGWVTLTTTDFSLYGLAPVEVRKKNGVTQMNGAVKPKTAGALSAKTFLTLPTAFRPSGSNPVYAVCHASSQNLWLLVARTNGIVTGERHGVASEVDVATNTWLPFSVTWLS